MAIPETTDQQLRELELLPETELLAIPETNIAPVNLVAVWERTAAVKEKQAEAETVTRSYARQRADESHERDQERRHAEAFLEFQQTMHDVRERSERLSARIEREEILARDRLREIDARALVLADGRRVYAGEKGEYIDEHGETLKDKDKEEAHALHVKNPNAATWGEKTDAEQQAENLRQLKEKVTKLHDDAGHEDGKGLSTDRLEERGKKYDEKLNEYEKDFDAQTRTRAASLSAQGKVTDESYGGADYMAAYAGAGRTTSYSATLDAKPNEALKKDFSSAAAGQGAPTNDKAPAARPQANNAPAP